MLGDYRVGLGYDVHRLAANIPLYLGGILVPHHSGLVGHSDADVLLHAVIDALLGAASLGDIGEHFPDNEQQFRGADSKFLLQQVLGLITERDWQIINIDCNIIAEQPKLAPFKAQIKQSIAALLGINSQQVNVKAKTNEKLGYLGEQLAIETQVIVLLKSIAPLS